MMMTMTDVITHRNRNREWSTIFLCSLIWLVACLLLIIASCGGFKPTVLSWGWLWVYGGGYVVSFLLTGIFCKLHNEDDHKASVFILLIWPALYPIMALVNFVPVIAGMHKILGGAHKKLGQMPRLFVRKPKLLQDKKMPLDSNMYRNNSECDACHRPL